MHYLELVKHRKDDTLDYFNDIPLQKWTLSHDNGFRYGYMTINLSESYNAIFKGVRKLPVATLVKKIFYNCVGYFKLRRAEAHEAMNHGERYSKFCEDKFTRWAIDLHQMDIRNKIDSGWQAQHKRYLELWQS